MLTQKVIYTFLEDIKTEIIKKHLALGQKATGNTLQEFEAEATTDKGRLLGASYVEVLETGRKPGKVPFGFKKIIEDWITVKGIPVKNKSIAAYFIARKIQREGTRQFRSGVGSGVLSTIITEQRINSFKDKFAKEYTSEVSTELINQFYK